MKVESYFQRDKFIITLVICCIFMTALPSYSAGFLDYMTVQADSVYSGKPFNSNYSYPAEWEKAALVFSDVFKYRIDRFVDTEKLEDRMDDLAEKIEDGGIPGMTGYEKDLFSAILYGSLAYIRSSDQSFSMLRSIKKASDKFEYIAEKYSGEPDAEFGTAAAELAKGIYFQESFVFGTVLGYRGNILNGLKMLDKVFDSECFTSSEAGLFLIEYYAGLLGDHKSSIKYSKVLAEKYPGSKYFKFLYAKDLYHSGKIRDALRLFKDINNEIGVKYSGFEYLSILNEAQCYYINGEEIKGFEVLKFAEKIHSGYLTEMFRNEWVFSVRFRQENAYRPAGYKEDYSRLSDDELGRKAEVFFDHGYFRETIMAVESIRKKNSDHRLLTFRSEVNIRAWEEAQKTMQQIKQDEPDFFEEHPDKKRLELLINIVNNALEVKDE